MDLVSTTAESSDTVTGLIVSVDNIHKPGSTSKQREAEAVATSPLQSYTFKEGKLTEGGVTLSSVAKSEEGAVERLGNLLYNLENLRKRDGDADE